MGGEGVKHSNDEDVVESEACAYHAGGDGVEGELGNVENVVESEVVIIDARLLLEVVVDGVGSELDSVEGVGGVEVVMAEFII